MMTKKKRKMIMILIPTIVVFFIVSIFLLLYLKTDMFKSNQTLFFKYMGKNVDNLSEIRNSFYNEQYDSYANANKYNKNLEFDVKYTENFETTSENTNNSINNLKLTLEENVDKDNNYIYGKIDLLNKEKSSAQVEYIKNDDIYGVGFPQLFKQYIVAEEDKAKEIISEITNIEDIDEISNKLDSDKIKEIKFSDEEIQKLKSKYIKIISEKISKDKFSKQGNQKITINEDSFTANEYKLTLNREQINNIYIDVLQTIKEEEIILNKIEKLQNVLPDNFADNDSSYLKQSYTSKIEEIIDEINKNNIGTEEINIIVYESKGTTLKTVIKTGKNEIEFSYLNNGQEKYADLIISENEKQKQKIVLTQKDNNIKISFVNYIDGETQSTTLNINDDIKEQNAKRSVRLTYIYDTNKVELNYLEEINVLNELDEIKEFDDTNSINLSQIDEEKEDMVLDVVSSSVFGKIKTLAEEINISDIQKMLVNIGLISEQNNFDANETSEVQKRRFNSQLEILQGEELEGERILRIIDVIGKSITNLQVVSNMELRIELNKDNGNEELTKILKEFLENNKQRKYSVAVEYDNTTGLVNNLMLTLIEKER